MDSTYILLLRLLGNDVHQTIFESLFVLCKPILLPRVVKYAGVEVVTLHAIFEESNTGLVVWCLFKLERSAVIHELLEFGWVSTAKILKWCFNFFLLDRVVLFVLASTGQALPWKRSFQQIEKNVTDAF